MIDTVFERAVHEAGHLCVAAVLGYPPMGCTVRGGSALSGFAVMDGPRIPQADVEAGIRDPSLPLVLQPASVRRDFECQVLIALAGELAEELVPRLALPETPRPVVEKLAAAIPEPPAALWDAVISAVDGHPVDAPGGGDDGTAVELFAAWAHPCDERSRKRWLAFLEEQCAAIIAREAGRIQHVALVLSEAGTISGDDIAGLLDTA